MLGAASKADLADGGEPGSPRRRAVQLVLVAGLALVGGSGFTRLFPARDLWVPLPVAAVLPVLLVGLLGSVQVRSRRRLASPAITVPVWAIGFTVWTTYTVAAGTGGFLARLDVVRMGVVDGWARLLDVAAPAPADPDLLIVALAPTWLAAAIGAELTLRTRACLAPALPAALTLVAATAVSLPAPGSNLPQAVALVATTAAYLLTRMPRTARNSLAWQWARGAGATVTVLTASVLVAVTVLGAGRAGDPVDPRDHRSVRPAGTEGAADPGTEGDAGDADRGRWERSDSAGAWPPWVTLAGLALGGVTVLYLALALLAAEARRRLRRAARARTRVVAAWEGAIEALTDAAVPVPAAASPGQVARLAATARVGPAVETDLAGLADLVTLALFAPAGALDWDGEPGTRTAAEAWRRLDQIERSLRRGEDRRGHARRIRRALLRALAPATVRAGLRGLWAPAVVAAVVAVATVATGLPDRDDLSGRDDPSGGGGSPAGSAPDRDRIASPA